MKATLLGALLVVLILYYPCQAQTRTDAPKDTNNKQTLDVVTAYGPATSVRVIKQDRKGNLWLASNEGIIRCNGQSFTNLTANLSKDRFFSLEEDRNGNFWFGTYGSGVYYYDGKSFQHMTTQQGLANNQVSTIYEDKTGNVWFGTNGAVSRYDGKSFQNFTTKGGYPANDVNAILEDKSGKLWFGTRGHTYVYDGKTFAVFNHQGGSLGDIWSIIEDQNGTIWFGGNTGLWRYDGSTTTQVMQTPVLRVYQDTKGNFWLNSAKATGQFALSHYDEKSLFVKHPMGTEIAQSQNLFGILEARDGRIWFGTVDGVHRYDGTTITNFNR